MAAAPPSSSALALFGLAADAPVEDIEYALGTVKETLTRIDAKRGVLQERIAATAPAASRDNDKRRRHAATRAGARPPPVPVAAAVAAAAPRPMAMVPVLPRPPGNVDDDHGAPPPVYSTRRGRLRDAASATKMEMERMEAVCRDLEEALVDAKEWLALQRGGTAQ